MAMTARWLPSPNHAVRTVPVDMVVLHYTDMVSVDSAVSWLCNPQSRVSTHYVVAPDGSLIQMVEEAHIAWHAGQSYWRGVRDNNARSIGIELASEGHRGGIAPTFPVEQVDALMRLLDTIHTRHTVPARNVVGHSDIAPHRKMDPGERFPWARLGAAGHVLAPNVPADLPAAPLSDEAGFADALSAIGYAPALKPLRDVFETAPTPGSTLQAPGAPSVPALLPAAEGGRLWPAVGDAFHRRFRPSFVGQAPDAGSLALARAIAATLPTA